MEYGSDEWINYSLGLEVERVDTTHADKTLTEQELSFAKFAQGKRELRLKKEQLETMREQRDKLFFNAGRWAGGARDEVAEIANKVVEALLDSEI
jgi:DNA-binding PadR family transcriptional regulator